MASSPLLIVFVILVVFLVYLLYLVFFVRQAVYFIDRSGSRENQVSEYLSKIHAVLLQTVDDSTRFRTARGYLAAAGIDVAR